MSEPGRSPVRLEYDGPLAVVSVDAPPLNLYDAALGAALQETISTLESQAPRAVLFRADGRVVSGGVDVELFAALDGPDAARRVFEGLVGLTQRVERLSAPTVFAAHALCLTWALELALACDIILAAESATFGLVERVIGLTPAMGGTQRFAERAGSGRAKEFVMTGSRYDARTLERWNVVNRVLPDEDFDRSARAFAHDLADGPTRAHAATKQVVRDFLDGGVALADERMPAVAGALWETEDLRGAIRSFLDEGPGRARFRGC